MFLCNRMLRKVISLCIGFGNARRIRDYDEPRKLQLNKIRKVDVRRSQGGDPIQPSAGFEISEKVQFILKLHKSIPSPA